MSKESTVLLIICCMPILAIACIGILILSILFPKKINDRCHDACMNDFHIKNCNYDPKIGIIMIECEKYP